MTYEQNNSLNFYRFSAIALGVGILAVTICGSLGLVWMRQQVSAIAASASRLQVQIVEAERIGAGIEARLARELSPQHLAERLPQGLRPSASNQFVWAPAPQMLHPVNGFEQGTMIASREASASGASAAGQNAGAHTVAARNAAGNSVRTAGRNAGQGAGQQAGRAASAQSAAVAARSHLVSAPASQAAPAQAQDSVSVTFDLALFSNPASSAARQ